MRQHNGGRRLGPHGRFCCDGNELKRDWVVKSRGARHRSRCNCQTFRPVVALCVAILEQKAQLRCRCGIDGDHWLLLLIDRCDPWWQRSSLHGHPLGSCNLCRRKHLSIAASDDAEAHHGLGDEQLPGFGANGDDLELDVVGGSVSRHRR